jgi:hypothetical protein
MPRIGKRKATSGIREAEVRDVEVPPMIPLASQGLDPASMVPPQPVPRMGTQSAAPQVQIQAGSSMLTAEDKYDMLVSIGSKLGIDTGDAKVRPIRKIIGGAVKRRLGMMGRAVGIGPKPVGQLPGGAAPSPGPPSPPVTPPPVTPAGQLQGNLPMA